MKVNDKYLEKAQEVLGANAGGLLKDDKVASVYNGYISAFGGSMVQPGLYATVLTYYADEKKRKIADLIFAIYQQVNGGVEGNFLNFITNNSNNRQVRNKIAQAVIALKLVLRTYEFNTENEE